MTNEHTNTQMITGAILAGAGAVTIGLAAIADFNALVVVLGVAFIATGLVVMLDSWAHVAAVMRAIRDVIAIPFRAYGRLYRSQWRSEEQRGSDRTQRQGMDG